MYTRIMTAILVSAIIATTAALLMNALGPLKAMAMSRDFDVNPQTGNPHPFGEPTGNPHLSPQCTGDPHGQRGFEKGTCPGGQ
jgi:hypothetical protein